jgi:RNA polymerase sigma-70 factor (ECF subfamily)
MAGSVAASKQGSRDAAERRAGRQPDEALVVARARDGDHEAFRVLVERYQGRIHRLALRVLRDEERARDATQEAFIKVYGNLHRFEGRSSFYTWLYRLAFNLCLDLRRRDRSDREVEWQDERPGPEASGVPRSGDPPGPDRELERVELRGQIARAIEALPEDARQTLLLREVDGLAYAEIAEVLGIPKGTVMSRLYYARRRVQEALVEAGVEPPGGPAEEEER